MDMKISTMDSIPGSSIVSHKGLVSGSTVRAKHVLRDAAAFLRNMLGGEIRGYTELLNESRTQALSRMVKQAKDLGANAIVNVRFSTSSIAQGAAELYVYGTAVVVEAEGTRRSASVAHVQREANEDTPPEPEPVIIIPPLPEEE